MPRLGGVDDLIKTKKLWLPAGGLPRLLGVTDERRETAGVPLAYWTGTARPVTRSTLLNTSLEENPSPFPNCKSG
jgi:hypothetical protein